MSRASNSLRATDVTATPIKVKYSASYSNTTICDSGIYAKSGVNGPVTISGSVPEATLRYWSIRHLFYSNFLTGSFLTTGSSLDNFLQSTAASGTFEGNTSLSASTDLRTFPTQSGAKIKIINIPPIVYGEQVSKKTFFLKSADNTSFNLVDDGNGNVVDSLNNNVHVGNIIYPQGFVVVTNPDYYCVMDGGPTIFEKYYEYDISDLPKTFNPILDAVPDCAPIISSSITFYPYPDYLFPTRSVAYNGLVTLDANDPLTNYPGFYKTFYTLKSTYCGESDEEVITVQIYDVGVYGLSATIYIPPTSTPTPTPLPATSTPTPSPIPATATPTPVAATATPTPSPVPATATPTPSPVPATATPTPTPGPATATPTPSPTPNYDNINGSFTVTNSGLSIKSALVNLGGYGTGATIAAGNFDTLSPSGQIVNPNTAQFTITSIDGTDTVSVTSDTLSCTNASVSVTGTGTTTVTITVTPTNYDGSTDNMSGDITVAIS